MATCTGSSGSETARLAEQEQSAESTGSLKPGVNEKQSSNTDRDRRIEISVEPEILKDSAEHNRNTRANNSMYSTLMLISKLVLKLALQKQKRVLT